MDFLKQWLKDWLADDPPVNNVRRNYGFLPIYGNGRSYVTLKKEQIEIDYQGQEITLDVDHARMLVEDLADALGMGSFMVPAPVTPARWRADEIKEIADGLGLEDRFGALTLALRIYETGENYTVTMGDK